jgi:hypothetical protein
MSGGDGVGEAEDGAVASGTFGLVEGEVGAAEELGVGFAIAGFAVAGSMTVGFVVAGFGVAEFATAGFVTREGDGGSDADGEGERRVAGMEGLGADGGADALGTVLGLSAVAVGEEDEELLAAVASGDVVGAGGTGDAAADFAQDRVAGEVAVSIVDRLEVIDIEKKDAEAAVAAQGALAFFVKEVDEGGAVPEAGKGIMGGLVAKLLLGEEEIVLGGEEAGEGVAFFRGSGFRLDAEGVGFVKLLLDLAGLGDDAVAEAEVAGGDDEDEQAEGSGEDEGVAGGPPGSGVEDGNVVGGAEEEVDGLGRSGAIGMDDADALDAQVAADAEGVKGARGSVGGEDGEEFLTGADEQEGGDAVFAAGAFEEEAFELDGFGVPGAAKSLGSGNAGGRGERGGTEAADEGRIQIRSVIAAGGKADDVDEIAGAEGYGSGGGDEEAVGVSKEREVGVVKG